MWVIIQQSYTHHYSHQGSTYHEKSKRVTNSLHEELILSEVFLIDVQDLRVVEVADEKQSEEEGDHHVDSCKSKNACTQSEC